MCFSCCDKPKTKEKSLLWTCCVTDWRLNTDKLAALILNPGCFFFFCWSSVSVASSSDALFSPYICFSVHSAHALQLLDARRTKVCPYVCTTCCVHNIESPSVWRVFSDTWQSLLHRATSSPINPVASRGTIAPPSSPWTVVCLPLNKSNYVNPNPSGVPSSCCITDPTVQSQTACTVGYVFGEQSCSCSFEACVCSFLDVDWSVLLSPSLPSAGTTLQKAKQAEVQSVTETWPWHYSLKPRTSIPTK